MDFINQTEFPTLIHRAALDDEIIAMAVMCRITYDIKDGIAVISKKQEWELHQNFWDSEYGVMDKDDVYCKGGVDVMVFGSAKGQKDKKTTQSEVTIIHNDKLVHKVKIYGDRVWKSFLGKLSISNPEPFEEIPVTLANAFGGIAYWDGLEAPYPANPYGKGYYQEKKQATGNPLPNIEHSENPIKQWNSWQDPAGIGSLPMMSLKAKYSLKINEENQIERLEDTFFNSAFPELILEKIDHNDSIEIQGMTYGGPFTFKVPKTNLILDIELGEKEHKSNLEIDQVGIIPDKNQIFISYRYPFRYRTIALEKRKAKLTLKK